MASKKIKEAPAKLSKKQSKSKVELSNTKDADWLALEHRFVTDGKQTAALLSREYNIPAKTIGYRITKGKWVEKRENYQAELAEKMKNRTLDIAADLAAEWNKKDLEVFTALRGLAVRSINRLNLKDVDGKFLISIIDPKEMRTLATVLLAAQRGGRLTLGMTTENQGVGEPDDFVLTEEEKLLAAKFLDEHFKK